MKRGEKQSPRWTDRDADHASELAPRRQPDDYIAHALADPSLGIQAVNCGLVEHEQIAPARVPVRLQDDRAPGKFALIAR
jgi:hypothetical protein